jgi:hypothetical protein
MEARPVLPVVRNPGGERRVVDGDDAERPATSFGGK